MPTVTAYARVSPLLAYEPDFRQPPRVPRQRVPRGQLTLDLWLDEHRAVTDPEPGIDRQRVAQVIAALLEIRQGFRPVTQARGVVTPQVYADLASRHRAGTGRFALRSVHVRQPVTGSIEACGRVEARGRSRAVAARFDQGPSGWLCGLFTIVEPGRSRT